MGKKQIRVTESQRDELHNAKRPGESYSDVLERVYGVGVNGA